MRQLCFPLRTGYTILRYDLLLRRTIDKIYKSGYQINSLAFFLAAEFSLPGQEVKELHTNKQMSAMQIVGFLCIVDRAS